ncbi:MAG: DUF1573 domain-containing protein [Peptococcaceae bacterium]|nr:DUF1573 domain-containing protein [Peptococcaceae bacterium]
MGRNLALDDFQNTVSELLICNRSILDALAKVQENSARLQWSVIKSVTRCGCIEINASRASIPPEATLADLKQILDSHVKGELCENCREFIAKSVGRLLFYTTAVCNLLDLNIYDILQEEQKQMKMLGYYNLA